jgi:SAM-dependent methyltransferase
VTLRVLQNRSEIQAARAELRRRMISYYPERPPRSLADRLLLRPPIAVGDVDKSWDVLESIRLIESRLAMDAPILDLGAFASEILCSLHLLGFRRLTGIDLNPRVQGMPFNRDIRYVAGDMNAVPLADGSLAAITAVSAIEHGVELRTLFREVARLLAPGGLFLASTDYWPDKIDTSGIRMFDLEWTIFSQEEIKALFEEAARHGLAPLGDCRFGAAETPIECAGRRYTFAWFALAKR